MPAGSHKLTVTAVGYAVYESPLVVEPIGAAMNLSVSLVPSGEQTPRNGRRIGGFVALGAGVALGVVGLVSAIEVNRANNQLTGELKLVGQNPKFDACDTATYSLYRPNGLDPKLYTTKYEGICGRARALVATQLVTFPLSAVAAGVGIFLVATSSKKTSAPNKAGWTVLPHFGPTGGTVELGYRF